MCARMCVRLLNSTLNSKTKAFINYWMYTCSGKKKRQTASKCFRSRLIQEWCCVTQPTRQPPFQRLTSRLFSKYTGCMLWFLLGHEKWQHQKFIILLQNECASEWNSGLLFDLGKIPPPQPADIRGKAGLSLPSLELDNKQIELKTSSVNGKKKKKKTVQENNSCRPSFILCFHRYPIILLVVVFRCRTSLSMCTSFPWPLNWLCSWPVIGAATWTPHSTTPALAVLVQFHEDM